MASSRVGTRTSAAGCFGGPPGASRCSSGSATQPAVPGAGVPLRDVRIAAPVPIPPTTRDGRARNNLTATPAAWHRLHRRGVRRAADEGGPDLGVLGLPGAAAAEPQPVRCRLSCRTASSSGAIQRTYEVVRWLSSRYTRRLSTTTGHVPGVQSHGATSM